MYRCYYILSNNDKKRYFTQIANSDCVEGNRTDRYF